jgi:hypothetical protein
MAVRCPKGDVWTYDMSSNFKIYGLHCMPIAMARRAVNKPSRADRIGVIFWFRQRDPPKDSGQSSLLEFVGLFPRLCRLRRIAYRFNVPPPTARPCFRTWRQARTYICLAEGTTPRLSQNPHKSPPTL